MRASRRAVVSAAVLVSVLGWAPSSAAPKPPPAWEVLIPPAIFGEHSAQCWSHNASAFGTPSGEKAGHHYPYVAVTKVCETVVDETHKIDLFIPCDKTPPAGGKVTCGAMTGPDRSGTAALIEAMQMRGDIPLANPNDQSIRYSTYLLAPGGHIEPPVKGFPDNPFLGANVLYQLVEGDPGITTQPSTSFFEVDRRNTATLYPPTAASVWVHGNTVVFMIPLKEVAGAKGFRDVSYGGPLHPTATSAAGAQEVVPGGVHAPYGWIPISKLSK